MQQPQRRRRRPRRRNGRKSGLNHHLMLWVGWGFIVLGIIGSFLPILQGFLFLAIGLVILSRRSPRVRLLVLRLGRRYPKLRRGMEHARMKMRQYKHAFLRRLPWRRRAHRG